jgi:DNA-binding response OmpR family regulator
MQPTVAQHILLVSDPEDEYGLQRIQGALASHGAVRATTEGRMATDLASESYALVIIDAGAVRRVAPVVEQARQASPETKIVVITASEHWKVARDAYRAGAAEYLDKSLSSDELAASIAAILANEQGAPE